MRKTVGWFLFLAFACVTLTPPAIEAASPWDRRGRSKSYEEDRGDRPSRRWRRREGEKRRRWRREEERRHLRREEKRRRWRRRRARREWREGPLPWARPHGRRWRRRRHRRGYEERIPETEAVIVTPTVGINLGNCNRQTLGSVIGGVAGGVLGSTIGKGRGKTAASVAGAVIGALIGGAVGQEMDKVDQACVGQALEQAQGNQRVEWRNPDNDARYEVTPTRTYEAEDGQYCREYSAKALIGGREQTTTGTACRQPDGSWKIVN